MSVIRECAQGHRFEGLSPGPCPYCLGQLWRVDKSEKWDGGAPSATLTEKDLRAARSDGTVSDD